MDLDKAIETLKSCQIIPEEDVKNLCNKAKEILMEEQNVHHVPIPATVVGDIHGQFYDLLELFDVGGQVRLRNIGGSSGCLRCRQFAAPWCNYGRCPASTTFSWATSLTGATTQSRHS